MRYAGKTFTRLEESDLYVQTIGGAVRMRHMPTDKVVEVPKGEGTYHEARMGALKQLNALLK